MNEINRRTVYDGFFKLYKITYEDDGQTFDREVFVTGNAVAALMYDTRKDKFIFVKQFRPAVDQDMLELVAGILDKEGESPEELHSLCALRRGRQGAGQRHLQVRPSFNKVRAEKPEIPQVGGEAQVRIVVIGRG